MDKLMQLRKLHEIPEQKARTAMLAVEITGLSLFAAGLWLFMTDTVVRNEVAMIIAGAVNCILGWGLMALGQPVYHWVIIRQRHRIGPDVLRLADELLE